MVKESLLVKNLIDLLEIPSPTYQEEKIFNFVKHKFSRSKIKFKIYEKDHSLIAFPIELKKPRSKHISLVGHLDAVPKFFTPKIEKNRLYGSGASDMKGSLAVFLYLLDDLILEKTDYQLSFVFYAREEMTPLKENGLYTLIKAFPDYFNRIDLAIVAEPTDNQIHLGCMGSLHAEVNFYGKSCHSARPWQGKNAIYQAVSFIDKISEISPQPVEVAGVTFYDVIQMTECQSDLGITTVPGRWWSNVNYRYSPQASDRAALNYFKKTLIDCGAESKNIKIKSQTPSGPIHRSDFLDRVLKKINRKVSAKQAWTDVAQLARLNIPAFNYGPGLTKKCHTDDEYILKKDLINYTQKVIRLLS